MKQLLQDLQSKLDRADQLEQFLDKLAELVKNYQVLARPESVNNQPAKMKRKKRRRLTPVQIKSIRKLSKRGVGSTELSVKFDVSRSAIDNIRTGRSHSEIR